MTLKKLNRIAAQTVLVLICGLTGFSFGCIAFLCPVSILMLYAIVLIGIAIWLVCTLLP